MISEQKVLKILNDVGAVITDSHIVYTSGKHGSAYINKDGVYPRSWKTSLLCKAIAEQFVDDGVEVVVAPAIGGTILSQWVGFHMSKMTNRNVLSIYSERAERLIFKVTGNEMQIFAGEIALLPGEELVVKENHFVIKRGYDKLVMDGLVAKKRVLVVEDVLTTGASVRKVVEATRILGSDVVGLGVLCNRGGVTPQDVGNPPKFFSLVNIKLDSWEEAECPLCARGVPINIDVGKGKEYLAQKAMKA